MLPKGVRFSLVLLLMLGAATRTQAGGPFTGTEQPHWLQADTTAEHKENTRLVGSTLAVLLGPFAAHRIYLGTTPKVAIFYGVTFGGFGVLPLIDLGHLLFTKDLTPYRNNDRVFMWTAPKAASTPP
jgi:hypothetical protein